MNSNDFRIGNMILDVYSKITRLMPNKCSYKRGEINTYSIDYKNITPVLLTNELLLNFGFTKGVVFLFENEKFNIQINKIHNRYYKAYYYGKLIKRDIYYVHELQNIIFSLYEEELL